MSMCRSITTSEECKPSANEDISLSHGLQTWHVVAVSFFYNSLLVSYLRKEMYIYNIVSLLVELLLLLLLVNLSYG